MLQPKPQQIYRHFKGNYYQILTIAIHSETGEELVIYQALYGDFKVYARPLSMFLEKVDSVKYKDASQTYRFELVDPATLVKQPQGEVAKLVEKQQSEEAIKLAEKQQSEEVAKLVEKQQSEEGRKLAEKAVGEVRSSDDRQEESTWNLDPLVLAFLDADSFEKKLEILSRLHLRITDEMIDTMAVSVDIEIKDGEIEDRYNELKNCLLLYDKFETNRLR